MEKILRHSRRTRTIAALTTHLVRLEPRPVFSKQSEPDIGRIRRNFRPDHAINQNDFSPNEPNKSNKTKQGANNRTQGDPSPTPHPGRPASPPHRPSPHSNLMLKGRFAASPTGYLHNGGARAFIFNRLYPCRGRGTMILRIDDTDACLLGPRTNHPTIRSVCMAMWNSPIGTRATVSYDQTGCYNCVSTADAVAGGVEVGAIYGALPAGCISPDVKAGKVSLKRAQAVHHVAKQLVHISVVQRTASGLHPVIDSSVQRIDRRIDVQIGP